MRGRRTLTLVNKQLTSTENYFALVITGNIDTNLTAQYIGMFFLDPDNRGLAVLQYDILNMKKGNSP